MAEFWDSEKVIREIEKGKGKIVVKSVTKGQTKFVDVRNYYKQGNEWKPGKGIAIPDDLADEIADAIMSSSELGGDYSQDDYQQDEDDEDDLFSTPTVISDDKDILS